MVNNREELRSNAISLSYQHWKVIGRGIEKTLVEEAKVCIHIRRTMNWLGLYKKRITKLPKGN